jgi:ATP-dependent helicase/DNAse subunit B
MSQSKISFSQYQLWKKCPRHWKLRYIDGIRKEDPGVAAIFGTAMHETLQEYLTVMYNNSVTQADSINLNESLREKFSSEYKKALEQNNNVHFSTSIELNDYYNDGVAILDFFKKNRNSFFPKKNFELMGIELPIETVATEKNKNIVITGFLDIVVKDTKANKVHIIDFKTSTKGWGKYQKSDQVKISQLILYKKFFSEQYSVDVNDIHIEYLILKRKINESSEFGNAKKRVQRFTPPSGTIKLKQISSELSNFITTVFNQDGTYNTDKNYIPVAGFNGNNCRFCEFKDDYTNCPLQDRV